MSLGGRLDTWDRKQEDLSVPVDVSLIKKEKIKDFLLGPGGFSAPDRSGLVNLVMSSFGIKLGELEEKSAEQFTIMVEVVVVVLLVVFFILILGWVIYRGVRGMSSCCCPLSHPADSLTEYLRSSGDRRRRQAVHRCLDDEVWLNRITRTGSEGSLPTYSATATQDILNRQAGIRNQINRGTFTGRTNPPTVIEMEDLGSESGEEQPPPPGENPVNLPPPCL